MKKMLLAVGVAWCGSFVIGSASRSDVQVIERDVAIEIVTPQLEAAVRKKGYVSGVYRQTFLDKKTGFHGKTPKRSIEGPQICTRARELQPQVIRGGDFAAIRQQFKYRTAAPGKKTGSVWTQVIVFPLGKRYFISMDRIDSVNSSDAMFLRIDMPGHIRHNKGDTFSEIYLSYYGKIAASEFAEDFAPDEKFLYRRGQSHLPERFIRACRLRDPKSGKSGPWLAGMTLQPDIVYEAWCHQRGYVCMIEEFGGRPIKPGESFSGAFIVGYFDSIEEMHEVYDKYVGNSGLEVSEDEWKLVE